MEEIVSLKKELYSEDSQEFQKSAEKLCELLNMSAMIFLQKEKYDISLEFLRKAEMLSYNSFKYKATTYNNLACFYRRTGKLRTALNYLLNALDIEINMDNMGSLADTHLNLCAVLSQLDKHEDALQHALLSIVMLQDEFLQQSLKYCLKTSNQQQQFVRTPTNSKSHLSQQSSVLQLPIINEERLAVLAIAYHNLGVEYEHLKKYKESLQIYNKAYLFAKEYLGPQHQLVTNLQKVVHTAQIQIENSKFKQQAHLNLKKQQKREIYKEVNRDFNNQQYQINKNLPRLRQEKLSTSGSQNIYKNEQSIPVSVLNNHNVVNQANNQQQQVQQQSNNQNNAAYISRTFSGNKCFDQNIQNNNNIRDKDKQQQQIQQQQQLQEYKQDNKEDYPYSTGTMPTNKQQKKYKFSTVYSINNSINQTPNLVNQSTELSPRGDSANSTNKTKNQKINMSFDEKNIQQNKQINENEFIQQQLQAQYITQQIPNRGSRIPNYQDNNFTMFQNNKGYNGLPQMSLVLNNTNNRNASLPIQTNQEGLDNQEEIINQQQ